MPPFLPFLRSTSFHLFLNFIGENIFPDKMIKTVHPLETRKWVPSLTFKFRAVAHLQYYSVSLSFMEVHFASRSVAIIENNGCILCIHDFWGLAQSLGNKEEIYHSD